MRSECKTRSRGGTEKKSQSLKLPRSLWARPANCNTSCSWPEDLHLPGWYKAESCRLRLQALQNQNFKYLWLCPSGSAAFHCECYINPNVGFAPNHKSNARGPALIRNPCVAPIAALFPDSGLRRSMNTGVARLCPISRTGTRQTSLFATT
jgi:hypothetical protein